MPFVKEIDVLPKIIKNLTVKKNLIPKKLEIVNYLMKEEFSP